MTAVGTLSSVPRRRVIGDMKTRFGKSKSPTRMGSSKDGINIPPFVFCWIGCGPSDEVAGCAQDMASGAGGILIAPGIVRARNGFGTFRVRSAGKGRFGGKNRRSILKPDSSKGKEI